MEKKSKRISSHPKLTAEKKRELRQAAEEEQALRYTPEVQVHDLRIKQKAIAQRALQQLRDELVRAKGKQKLSYADLAERSGIDRPALNRLLTGKLENPTIDTLVRVCDALGQQLTITTK